ncbi:hypothetical protein SEUCBS139899_000989 [Sporothrix eucalyptigena]|uniref:Interferon-induced 6-16 n=1 Tax=Sporothrix eucalyptigena TaxID=1812306 RepID=A0ABP0C7H1_9PEZI
MDEFLNGTWTFVKQNQCLSACYAATGLTATVAVAPGIVTAAALPALGFAVDGVIKGSLAATWQSSIGSVVAPSIFATLQSAGALGAGAATVAGAVSAAATGTAGVLAAVCLKGCMMANGANGGSQ